MEPEGSIPHSRVPATCPYPEPARSSPYPKSYFLKIHLTIILPSMPGSPKWSFSLRFPHWNPVCLSPLPNTCYMPRPFPSSGFCHPNTIGWRVQNIQLLIMQLPRLPCYLVPYGPKYSPQHHILKHFSLRSSLTVSYQVSHPYKTTGRIIVLYIYSTVVQKRGNMSFCLPK